MDVVPEPHVDFNYLFYFIIDYNLEKCLTWIRQYWWSSVIFSIIYLLLIFLGQRYMKNCQAYDLRRSLFVWNSFLAIFSFASAYHCLCFVYHLWTKHGFSATICAKVSVMAGYDQEVYIGYWLALFAISKLIELGDTVFIVLRKRKLVFLHYYHHITVMIYTWYSLAVYATTGFWFVTMNCMVHSVMYLYFALTAANFKIPRAVAMGITLGQISQMVLGLYINWHAFSTLQRMEECFVTYRNIASSMIMYGSYWVLFAYLFYANYLKKNSKKKCN